MNNEESRTVKNLWKDILFGTFVVCLAFVAPVVSEDSHDHKAHTERVDEAAVHGEERSVHLSASEIEEFGIRLSQAEPGVIGPTIDLAGEIVFNPDRFAHVVPRVGGVVRRVHIGLGDRVEAGTVMATIDSRELSDLKSTYLGAVERRELARTSFEREEGLWEKDISSERDFLQAKQVYAEARIEARSAEHKLRALGFSEAYLTALSDQLDVSFTRFQIRAPFEGVIVAKHITLGETVGEASEVFSVADLSQVWAILTVYPKDLRWMSEGMRVVIRDREGGAGQAEGQISYVSPVIDEATRTASIRVVIENQGGVWRPGMFVRGRISVEGKRVAVAIARTAVQNLDGGTVVFVYDGTEFELREVRTGRSTEDLVEIISGIKAGETIASQGAFTLKTQIEKGEFGSGHSH